MKSSLKRLVPIVAAVVLLGGTFGTGFYAGFEHRPAIEKVTALSNKEEGMPEQVDFSAFWKAWHLLDEKYVATKKGEPVDTQARVWGAIQGLTSSLGDPYTVFFPPEDAELFESEISGAFDGVGMEIGIRDGILTVIAPLKGTPAERSGIKTGDKIIEINAEPTADLAVDKAVKLIRGKKGTEVIVKILREGEDEPREIKMIRDTIDIPTLETQVKGGTASSNGSSGGGTGLREDGVFVIRLFSFSAKSPDLFGRALEEFTKTGSNKLVLDLRGNPGGYLEAAVHMASFFLPSGKVIVKEEFGNGKEDDAYRSKGFNIFDSRLKMVILVDGGSASASEILAGALQEHGVAKLVGTKTFGKGSVQELVNITDDTSLKVTIARWLTPNGKSISEGGLTPDVEVKLDPKQLEKDGKTLKDLQMEKAIEIVNAK